MIEEAFQLLRSPGVKAGSPEAIELLHSSEAQVNLNDGIVQIPEELILNSLETAPCDFYLYNADGDPAVHYSDNEIHFDPGSSWVIFIVFSWSFYYQRNQLAQALFQL